MAVVCTKKRDDGIGGLELRDIIYERTLTELKMLRYHAALKGFRNNNLSTPS